MKLLTNSAGSYLTGDDIADAVMAYGRALVEEQCAAVVDVPFLNSAGSDQRVQLTVGWGIALNAIYPVESPSELVDDATVDHLKDETARLVKEASPSGDAPFAEPNVAWLPDQCSLVDCF
ncbi:hypothetical protein LK09_07620 [Microbacterium mangrovi]|uniref:Uncharacterized protein n=1 Tax=Microbacterium mangrovi TaxID=1348253 RepID=A0A0B2AAL7_9MICO|nr:hypothetical protein [Microbacterium mangrovi]KHK98768.1 hypothetical protein LK09_07620 [Microbacterium mangrovi]